MLPLLIDENQAIEDLVLPIECCPPSEIENRILFLPLGS
jgi:hypothetical protein